MGHKALLAIIICHAIYTSPQSWDHIWLQFSMVTVWKNGFALMTVLMHFWCTRFATPKIPASVIVEWNKSWKLHLQLIWRLPNSGKLIQLKVSSCVQCLGISKDEETQLFRICCLYLTGMPSKLSCPSKSPQYLGFVHFKW